MLMTVYGLDLITILPCDYCVTEDVNSFIGLSCSSLNIQWRITCRKRRDNLPMSGVSNVYGTGIPTLHPGRQWLCIHLITPAECFHLTFTFSSLMFAMPGSPSCNIKRLYSYHVWPHPAFLPNPSSSALSTLSFLLRYPLISSLPLFSLLSNNEASSLLTVDSTCFYFLIYHFRN